MAAPSLSESDSDVERPNRWEGAPSTWQDMNREEITTLTALNALRNEDLSVHLYNTFALKQRHQRQQTDREPVPELDINAATRQLVHADEWVPQRSWTAWPVSAAQVPPDAFVRRTAEDPDEKFTVRKMGREMPSLALEEAVSAAMLRFARERFEGRAWEDEKADDEEDDDEEEDEDLSDAASSVSGSTGARSRSRSRAASERPSGKTKGQKGNGNGAGNGDKMKVDNDDSESDGESPPPPDKRALRPAVSIDDEMSYKLLRPSVRHILTKLDATLMVLHNSRETVTNYLSDSSDNSEASELSTRNRLSYRSGSQPPDKKKRGRPRKSGLAIRKKGPALYDDGQGSASRGESEGLPPPKKKVGRPRKTYPRLEGETDREYAVRIAIQRKEPIPIFSDSDSDSGDEAQSEASGRQARRKRQMKRKLEKQRDVSSDGSRGSNVHREKNRMRLGLRDWRDVLGAAAVSGFPHAALDRAARRCADLFGQSMELRTLTEGRPEADKLIRYEPGMNTTPVPDTATEPGQESDGDDWEALSQTKRRIRSASVGSDDSRGRSRSASRSAGRARSRSRSVASASGLHFCSIRGCSRGVDGFPRRYNLVRHVRRVHGLGEEEIATDVDSEDEMEGAVHVDGFLKPIKIRQGWRGEDVRRETSPNKRQRGGRGRKRNRSRSESSSERGRHRRPDRDVDMDDISQ